MTITRRGLLKALGTSFGVVAVSTMPAEALVVKGGKLVRQRVVEDKRQLKPANALMTTVPAAEDVVLGDVVYMHRESGKAARAHNECGHTILGVCYALPDPGYVDVLLLGVLTGFEDLTIGDLYYVDDPGEMSTTRPFAQGVNIHVVGQVIAKDSFYVQPRYLGKVV